MTLCCCLSLVTTKQTAGIIFQILTDDNRSSSEMKRVTFQGKSVTSQHAVMQIKTPHGTDNVHFLLSVCEMRLLLVSMNITGLDRQRKWWLVLQAERHGQPDSCLHFMVSFMVRSFQN